MWQLRGPKLLASALVFCWAGDVLGNPRLIGIGPGGVLLSAAAYAVADGLFLALFVSSMRAARRSAPVRGRGTTTSAFGLDVRAVVGAACLLGSQLLAVLEVGGRIDGSALVYRLPALALYQAGIVLISVGIMGGVLRVPHQEGASTLTAASQSRGMTDAFWGFLVVLFLAAMQGGY